MVAGLFILIALPPERIHKFALNGMWILLIAYPGVYAILNGRKAYGESTSPWSASLQTVSFLSHALIVAACALVLAAPRRRRTGALGIGRGALIYLLLQGLVIVVHGSWSAILGWLVVALVLWVIITTHETAEKTEWRIRWGLRTYISASLAAMVINPQWALVPETSNSRSLFGIEPRLIGFTDSSNYLGLISAMLFALELAAFSRQRKPSTVMFAGLALTTCLFTQSRTPLFAIVLVSALFFVKWAGLARFNTPRQSALLTVLACSSLIPPIISLYASSNTLAVLERVTTGRTTIWNIAFEEFMKSPLIGAGHGVFSTDFWASRPSPLEYSNAHNQVLETVARGGLIELLGLVVFLVAIVRMTRRVQGTEFGFAVLLLATVTFCQLATGTPFRTSGITWNLLELAALVGLGAASFNDVKPEKPLRAFRLR